MENETIQVPRRTTNAARDLAAVFKPAGAIAGDVVVPPEVAEELGLRDGQALRVRQRVVTHLDDGRIVQRTLDEGARSDVKTGYVDAMDLLQVLIDETVEDSNFGVHPGAVNRALVVDMDAPAFAWWLFGWLGGKRLIDRIRGATAGPLGVSPRKSRGEKPATQ